MATGDESVTITGAIDVRTESDGAFPVWEIPIIWTYDADDAGAEVQTVNINGLLRKIMITLPATTTTGTTSQILIKDSQGDTIFDSGELDENDSYTFNVDEPLAGAITVSLEPSTFPGANGVTPTVTLRGV